MDDPIAILCASFWILVVVYLVRWRFDPLNAIPTVGGPSAPLLSYWTAWKFQRSPKEILTEGYRKFHGSVFKVALHDRWVVVASGPRLIDELRNRPEDEISFIEASEQLTQIRILLSDEARTDHANIEIIREKLTRSLPAIFPEVMDELAVAVSEHVPTKGDKWTAVHAVSTVQNIIARVSNRAFVGLPVCRNNDFLRLGVECAVMLGRQKPLLRMLPPCCKGIARLFATRVRGIVEDAVSHLKPVLEERRAKMEEYGANYPEKPNDILQWILEHDSPRGNSDLVVTERVMRVNFVSIHTSSLTFTHALYHLAASPEYIQPLRDEIDSLVATEGWSKATMGKMWKVDSFLKESTRFNGLSLASITRIAVKDVTLSDGTLIPAGTLIVAAAYPLHRDETRYSAPDVFDPFRFSRMRENGNGEDVKHQFVNTSTDYISFGHGKRACPGRFFAGTELKAMLAYLVLHYDMKFPDDGPRPENNYNALNMLPDLKAMIMFRKRST